jgi:hypothetical protein
MQWYAVRSVLKHREESKTAIFEERVLLYQADSPIDAFRRASSDTKSYLADNIGFEEIGEPTVFALFDWITELNGAVAWSCLFRAESDAKEFWKERYERYSLPPETGE